MITLLYGEDTYRSREELKKIIEEYKKASLNWFNFVRIDAKNKEAEILEQIRQTANTTSMFDVKKLLIVENIAFATEDEQKNVLEFLEKKNADKDKEITIVFWDEKFNEKSDLFKFFKNNAKLKKFEPLKGAALRNWVKDCVVSQKGSIEGQALDRLIDYVGNDLWRMVNETNKLLDYDKKIKIENIDLLTKPEIDINVFSIVDALGIKDKNRALKLIGKYFEKGEDEIRLLGMFVYQFRNLLKIKSSDGENPGLHYFVFQKSQAQAMNFTFEELKKIYHRLMTIDLDMKLGRVEPMAALELFVAGL